MKSERTEMKLLRQCLATRICLAGVIAGALIIVSGSPAAVLASPRPAAAEPPVRRGSLLLPPPQYPVRLEKNVMIRMRDGVRLATDLYVPVGATPPLPVIFWMRGGYPKNAYRPDPADRVSNSHPDAASRDTGNRSIFNAMGLNHGEHSWLASQGFVVAVQDARGKYDSEGTYTLVQHYREDLYDSIDWLAHQEWSNGRVGTIGCSYGGEAQLYMSPAAHPALKAMIPEAAGSSIGSAGGFYSYANIFDSGALQVGGLAEWYYGSLNKVRTARPPGVSDAQWSQLSGLFDLTPKIKQKSASEWAEILNTLPEIELLRKAGLEPGGVPMTDWRDFVGHMNDVTSPFWDQFDFVKEGAISNVPALFVTSWYDINPRADLYLREMFERTATTELGKSHQHIIVSPSPHCRSEAMTSDYKLGPLELGDPRFGHYALYLQWFEHWLKDAPNGMDTLPKVQYYVMGKNMWKAANEWPLTHTRFVKFYLRSNGQANSHNGDGVLSMEPGNSDGSDSFVYDPGNPVRTVAGPFCGSACPQIVADTRSASARSDVLVYTSAPLPAGLEITGPVDATLFLSSSAKDTDLVVTLSDVYPDGRALFIREDLLRVRYREGRDRSVFMRPGQTYRVPIRVGSTSLYLAPGHRIRVQIASSSFPAWGRNLNTGGRNYDETEWIVARNTIHHSAKYPSHIVLPVVEDGNQALPRKSESHAP